MSSYEDARGHALAVVVTQALYIAAVVANLVIVFCLINGVTAVEPYSGFSDGAVLATFFIAALAFAVWTWRVVDNARSFKPSMNATPGWAIGWYFVPIASLFKPFGYMEETWDASSSVVSRRSSMLLRWWWGLWLVSGILGSLGNIFSRAEAQTGQFGTGLGMIVISLILRVGVSALVMKLALQLAAMQREKRRGVGTEAEVFA